ncbi:MAG: acyl-CoA thioesterase [Neisseriaceae bacterium]|nr:acyl-CoA thioesterase [Neisseriaceae bacterium]
MKQHIYCRHFFECEIPFFDVDALNVAWHGNYVKYFEMARCAFLNEIAHNYNDMRKDGFCYPIVKLQVKYMRPARFGQKIRIETQLVDFESKLVFNYTISDSETGEKLTRATTEQVAIRIDNQETQFIIPNALQQAIKQYQGFQAA